MATLLLLDRQGRISSEYERQSIEGDKVNRDEHEKSTEKGYLEKPALVDPGDRIVPFV